MAIAHHIGLEIAEREIRMVELRSSDGFPMILHAAVFGSEFEYGSALLHSLPYNQKLAKSFIRDVSSIFNQRNITACSISIGLSPLAPLIATIPVDKTLNKDEAKQYLEWEARVLSGYDQSVELLVRTHPIREDETARFMLTVALPRPTVTFLRSVFEHMTFTVTDIDVGHFLVESALHLKHPGYAHGNYAVAGLFEDGCTIGAFQKETYLGYRYRAVSYKDHYYSVLVDVLHQLLLAYPQARIQSLAAFGSLANDISRKAIAGLLHIPVHRFDPGQGIQFFSGSEAEAAATHPPDTFEVALSAALLSVQ